jgi:hypothetical protein
MECDPLSLFSPFVGLTLCALSAPRQVAYALLSMFELQLKASRGEAGSPASTRRLGGEKASADSLGKRKQGPAHGLSKRAAHGYAETRNAAMAAREELAWGVLGRPAAPRRAERPQD